MLLKVALDSRELTILDSDLLIFDDVSHFEVTLGVASAISLANDTSTLTLYNRCHLSECRTLVCNSKDNLATNTTRPNAAYIQN